MTEQQENILIARLIEFREGSYNPTAMIRIIKSILSPLPHQDGASAEDVIKATIMGYVDPNNVAKISGELMRVFQSETAKVVAEKDMEIRETRDELVTWMDSNDRWKKRTLKAESELSAANDKVAEKDREIEEWRDNTGKLSHVADLLQSELSEANKHRTRLIESVKKWGGEEMKQTVSDEEIFDAAIDPKSIFTSEHDKNHFPDEFKKQYMAFVLGAKWMRYRLSELKIVLPSEQRRIGTVGDYSHSNGWNNCIKAIRCLNPSVKFETQLND